MKELQQVEQLRARVQWVHVAAHGWIHVVVAAPHL